SVYLRFKAAFGSGPYRPARDQQPTDEGPLIHPYGPYNTALAEQAVVQQVMPERTTGPTPLTVLADRIATLAGAARVAKIWLPPLTDVLTLDQITGPPRADADGLRVAGASGLMRVPLGLLDDPGKQWQGPWTLDLTAVGGHAAVMGGPQSGKTTL